MAVQNTDKAIATYHPDYEAIIKLLNTYFDGLYECDVEKLSSIFHDDAWLKGSNFRKTKVEWLEAVAARPIPRDEGAEFQFNIQSLEIINDQAMAKVTGPVLTARFIDFLGLLKEDGQWKIVNKMFTLI